MAGGGQAREALLSPLSRRPAGRPAAGRRMARDERLHRPHPRGRVTMTPLIDRYLQNVRLSLPSARRDDIVRELAEDIRSQVADREEELGRPLTDAEQDALLEQFGHPLALATRYGPQRHVIGPALFPVYWMALKIALGGALAVNVALAIAFLVNGQPPGRALGHLAS